MVRLVRAVASVYVADLSGGGTPSGKSAIYYTTNDFALCKSKKADLYSSPVFRKLFITFQTM